MKRSKNLYQVEALWYVMAEDEEEAQRSRPDLGKCSVYAMEKTDIDDVDADWRDVMPFDDDEERTCAEILAEREEAEVVKRLHKSINKEEQFV